MKVLQFGDCHLDHTNVDLTAPALEEVVVIAEDEKPDLAIFTGDAFVRRGHLHPEAVFRFRVACERIAAACRLGLVAIDGNHDLLFDGSAGSVLGSLGGRETDKSETGRIVIASRPMILELGERGTEVVVVAIPSIDRFRMQLFTARHYGQVDTALPPHLIEGEVAFQAIRSLIAEAEGKRLEAAKAGAYERPIPLVVAYHGTVTGAVLADERLFRTGIDVAVNESAFTGADLVALGHIHKAQSINRVSWYNGPIAPLSWGEKKVEPVVLLHDVAAGELATRLVPIPTVAQMLEGTVEFDSSDYPLDDLRTVIPSVFPDEEALIGARVRLIVRGPRSVLSLLKRDEVEKLFTLFHVRDLTLLYDVREEVKAKIDVADRRVDLVQAAALWYDLRPEDLRDAEERARLLALAEEVEGRIRDEELDARFDFRPLRLRLHNWAQFEDVDLDLRVVSGIVAVRGANTAGKSNLVRAIPFALFKAQEAGDVLADLIRQGTDEARVVLEFLCRGRIYRVTRRLRRGRNRAASQTLTLEVAELAQGEALGELTPWRIANEGDEAQTQAMIERLVGSREIFEGTVYAGQEAVAALLSLRPSEMKDLLATVLHRDFAGRVKIVADRRGVSERDSARLKASLAEIDSLLTDKVALERDLEDQEAATAILLKQLEQMTPVESAEGLLEDMVAEKARLEAELAGLGDLKKRLQEGSARRQELDRQKQKIEAAAERLLEAEAELEGLAVPPALEIAEVDRLRQRMKALQTEKDTVRRHYDAEVEAIQAASARLSYEAQTLRATCSAWQKDLERIVRDLELVDSVPCQGRPWDRPLERTDDPENPFVCLDHSNGLSVDMGTCRFIHEARERIGREASVRASLARDEKLVQELEEKIADAGRMKEELRRSFATASAALSEEISEITQKLNEDDSRRRTAEALVQKKAELEARAAVLRAEATVDVAPLNRELREIALRADDLLGKITALAEAQARAAALEETILKQRSAIASLKASIEALRQDHSAGLVAKARIEGRLAAVRERLGELEDLQKELERVQAGIRIFDLYESALGRDGVPFLLLERFAIPQIVESVNSYLAPTGFRVEIESDRLSVTAGVKAGVYITFSDGRGRHPVTAASGFQRIAIGSALRNALADLHAAATGTRLRCAIQDEGFGAYDETNIVGARETVRQIADRRELFVFVSHVGGLNEIADWIVTVTPVDGRSVIQVERGS